MAENDDNQLLNDPIGALEDGDVDSGRFELSEDGYYEKYLPGTSEREALHTFVYDYIKALETDNAQILRDVADNIDAYRAKPKSVGSNADEDPVITIPLIGSKIDQLVSFEVVTLTRPRPVVTIDPYEDDIYEVLTKETINVGDEGPMEMGATTTFDSEEVAATLESGVDYKLRERMPLVKTLKKISMDLKVANYSVLKVVYDTRQSVYRQNVVKRLPGGFARVDGTEERILRGKDSARINNVGLFAFLAPVDCDVEDAELLCELTPLSTTAVREGLSTGEYWYPKRDEWDGIVKHTTKDFKLTQDPERTLKDASGAVERHDVREVWFQWAPEVTEYDDEGKSYRVRKLMSMCGLFHMGAKCFLTLYRNPYHHGMPPYILVTEDEERRRRPELSLVGRVRVHQALISQCFHTDISNAYQASNFDIFCNPDSDAWTSIKEQGRRPGRLIPRYDEKEVEMRQAGANHPGLGSQIGYLSQNLTDTLGVSPYEEGSVIPGRTPADSIRQILQAGLQRPLMTLSAISDGMGRAIRMYLRVLKQFEPYGEIIPTKDPETREKLRIPFRHPVEEVLDNFRIALTAADEELAKEADQEQRIMMFNLIRDAGSTFAQMAGAMADVTASPAITGMFAEIFQNLNRALKLVIEPVRKDVKKFVPSDQSLQNLLMEKQQAVIAAMQQQAMMAQMGGGGGNPTGGGGPVSAGAGPGGGQMGAMAGPAGNAGGPPPAAPQGGAPPL